jgi:hypothetical protein
MTMPSDELHPKSTPISFSDFSGISVHDALIFQRVIRARSLSLETTTKDRAIAGELVAIDLQLSVYIAEEIRKQDKEA